MSGFSCAKCGAPKVGESDLCYAHGGEHGSQCYKCGLCYPYTEEGVKNCREHVETCKGLS